MKLIEVKVETLKENPNKKMILLLGLIFTVIA